MLLNAQRLIHKPLAPIKNKKMRLKLFILLGILLIIGCKENNPKIPIESKNSELITSELIDSLLKRKLELIRVEDQTLRLLLPEVNKKFEPNSDERKFFRRLIAEQDSICEIKVTEILDKYDWISSDRVGYFANQTLWLVIQHAPLETQEKYLPKLRESVENGKSEGWYLAFLEDRILMYKGEKQLYGSQAKPNNETGKTHIYPIENVSAVNERRAKINLKSIEDYAEQNGYVFDINDHK